MQPPPINLKIAFAKALIISLVTFAPASGKAQSSPQNGKVIFESNCATCHGTDGTKGRWGAKNLRVTTLNDQEIFTTITNGRGIMPRWGKKLNPAQITLLVAYIKTLKN